MAPRRAAVSPAVGRSTLESECRRGTVRFARRYPQMRLTTGDKSFGATRSGSSAHPRDTTSHQGFIMNKNILSTAAATNYFNRVIGHDSIKKGAAGFVAAALFAVISEAFFPSHQR